MMHAVLFDLDGTLVDNMSHHFEAWRRIASDLGIALDDARIQREFAGKKNDEIIPALLGRQVDAAEIEAIAEKKEALYRELYHDKVTLIAGAADLIAMLRARGKKVAIASAATKRNRDMVLGALNLQMDAVAGGEEAKRGKPHPDIFLLAAQRVGVDPKQCLVFEDAVLGVQAAVAAGATVAGITTAEAPAHLRAAGAKWTMLDYTALPADLVAAIL